MRSEVRWLAVELLGAGSLVGGVWLQWGPSWALMSLGSLLIGAAVIRAVRMEA